LSRNNIQLDLITVSCKDFTLTEQGPVELVIAIIAFNYAQRSIKRDVWHEYGANPIMDQSLRYIFGIVICNYNLISLYAPSHILRLIRPQKLAGSGCALCNVQVNDSNVFIPSLKGLSFGLCSLQDTYKQHKKQHS
jgi:hypothetical protein